LVQKTIPEASRFLAYGAIDTFSKGLPEVRRGTALAKAFCNKAAVTTRGSGSGMQGGMGLPQDMRLERYHRDVITLVVFDHTTSTNEPVAVSEVLGLTACL